MDCLLKTNLCGFCFLGKEEQTFQSSEYFEERTLIGLTFLLLVAGGLKARSATQLEHHQAEEPISNIDNTRNVSGRHSLISEPLSRTDSSTDFSRIPQQAGHVSSDRNIREVTPQGASRTKYRLNTQGKWEKQLPGEEQWSVTDNFDRRVAAGKALELFCQHYTRHNEINKKIEQEHERYAQQKQTITFLSELEQSQELLQEEKKHHAILLTLKEAQRYQDRLNGAAAEDLHRETTIEKTITLANHPNSLELLAEEMERDHYQLALYQRNYRQMEDRLSDFNEAEQGQQQRVEAALAHLNQALENRTLAIGRSMDLTQELPNHYQKNIKEVVSLLKARVLTILEAKISAIQSYNTFLHTLPFHEEKQRYLKSAEASFSDAAVEREQSHPNQKIIHNYICSAEFFQQAAAVWDANPEQSKFLNGAGLSLAQAAKEEQKENRNQQIFNTYIKAGNSYEQAAAVWDTNPEQSKFLNSVGFNLFKAAEEEQEIHPRSQVIARYSKAAEFFQQAAETWDTNSGKAIFLNNTGLSLTTAAVEEQKGNPKARVIQRYISIAKFYKQAADTWSTSPEKAKYLSNVAFGLTKAAEEEQKTNYNKVRVIQRYISVAEFYKQAADTWSTSPEKAKYLSNVACSLAKAAEEEQKTNYNSLVVERYISVAEFHKQAADTSSTSPEKAKCLSNAGLSLAEVAEEEQKTNPNQKIIQRYISVVEFYQQAAAIWDDNSERAASLYNAGLSLAKVAAEEQHR